MQDSEVREKRESLYQAAMQDSAEYPPNMNVWFFSMTADEEAEIELEIDKMIASVKSSEV